MKAVVREHIQQLDVGLGGGIVSEKIRVETIDNPMLVIGLGGTGIDALLRLKYQINRRFKLPEDPMTRKKQEKPANIEFMGFETNEQELRKNYKGISLDPINEFVLLSNSEVGGILQNRSILEPYITDWLSPELSISDGVGGASGNRQAGRLLLFTKITQVVQSIEKKINILSKGTNKKLIVFVLTGLSGGTGSGCYLDIAYIVRGIIEKEYGSSGVDRVNQLGYLFTPDVNLSNNSLSSHTRDYIKKNGYAALKELDYWMNVDERGERFKQSYGNILNVDSPLPPFNLCHLISATNTEGKQLENAYDYCMNVTAENITNFMASEEKNSGEEFAIHDYISNINMNIAQMTTTFSANYKYNIIGASSAVLPIEEMTTYLAYRLFKKIEKMFESAPTQEDVGEFERKIKIDTDNVIRRFEERVPEPLLGYENSERLSFNNLVKTQVINIDTELETGYLARAIEEYVKVKKQLPGEILEVFQDQANRVFLHPEQGPIYISRLIYNGDGFSVLKTILAHIESLKTTRQRMPQDIQDAAERANEKLADARSAFISKDKKKNVYISAKIMEYGLRADLIRTEYMIEFYEDLYQLLNQENSRMYNVFTEVLNALNDIFEKNGNILTQGEEVNYQGKKTYYWNVVSIPDIVKEVDKLMKEQSGDELIRDFTSNLLTHSNKWLKDQEMDIVSSISDFLTDHFGDLITKSMEEFLLIKFGDEEAIDKLVERKIASQLDEDAISIFHMNNSTGHLHFPSWGFVSVPVQAPSILKGIRNYQTNALGKSNFTIKESRVKNRIFWLNTKNGIPLYVYTPLKVYEESYEKTILDREGIGRHLVQTVNENWVELPSPIPEASWGDTYNNPRVKEQNQRVNAIFEEALEKKIIQEKDISQATSNRYDYMVTGNLNLNQMIGKYDINLASDKPNMGELKKCIHMLEKLLEDGIGSGIESGIETKGKRDVFRSINKERAKENFTRSPHAIRAVQGELAKIHEIESKLNEFKEILGQHQEEEELIDQFIQVMYTDTIQKKGAIYIYDKDLEEDPWEPFVNLLDVKNYYEYVIYDKFCNLPAKQKAMIMKKAVKRNTILTSSEDISELILKLDGLIQSYSERKEELDYEKDELANGEDIYTFYKQVLFNLNKIRRNLD
ncbi:MAG TPA: hypothetical protein GX707_00480 [Epulopiscium sp.]|nr:hypothetical protein [Candidatus Epulonipiscium sp.]